MKAKKETEGTQPQTEELKAGRAPPPEPPEEGCSPADTWILGSASAAVTESVSVVLSPTVCGHWSSSPRTLTRLPPTLFPVVFRGAQSQEEQ